MSGNWDIAVSGFGPFSKSTELHLPFGGLGAVVYAGNGWGKTCLSRLFRAAEMGADTLSDALVSHGCESGHFACDAVQDGRHLGALAVDKERGTLAQVDNQTGLLFHVFNGDYVQENLTKRHYAPSGDIRGYLMGRTSIELDEKRRRLQELGERGKGQRLAVEQAVARMRGDLKALGISPRLKEFAALSAEHILTMPLEADDYDRRLREYASLKSIPEDTKVEMLLPDLDRPDFDELRELIVTPYTRDLFSEAFCTAASKKRSFITQGLSLREGDTCPFCGQDLGEQALALIHLYEEYLSGRESLVVETLESEARTLMQLKAAYLAFLRTYQQRCQRYDSLGAALGGMANAHLAGLPSSQDFSVAIDELSAALRAKAADISVVRDVAAADALQRIFAAMDAAVKESNERIHYLNVALQKGSKRLQEAKRALCQEAAWRVRHDANQAISELVRLREEYRLLRNEIHREESEGCQSKRAAVAGTLEALLHEVFDDKYRFDRESFSVVFESRILGEQAEEVLSDGEKAALAFCHYVASTMELLNVEADAQRLCFVIDDPATGLDEPHMERIVQVMGRLGELLGLPQAQVLVLTHNATLASMLSANGTMLSSCALPA